MEKIRSAKAYNVISTVVFIVLVGFFSYMGVFDWLPALIISFGLSISIRQLLLGCHVDVLVSLILFSVIFFFSFMHFFSRLFLPTFLIIGAFYYLLRQFFDFNKRAVKEDHHDETPPVAPES